MNDHKISLFEYRNGGSQLDFPLKLVDVSYDATSPYRRSVVGSSRLLPLIVSFMTHHIKPGHRQFPPFFTHTFRCGSRINVTSSFASSIKAEGNYVNTLV